jgi:hypothetical protein
MDTVWQVVQAIAAFLAGYYIGMWECDQQFAAGFAAGVKAALDSQ